MRLLPLFAILVAAPAFAAPISADVTTTEAHLWSIDTFLVAGFWTPDVDATQTLDHPFTLGHPIFDGKLYRVDVALPAYGCGTFQVDAWAHGGWFGEVRHTGLTCEPSRPLTPREPPQTPQTPEPPVDVPEPVTALLLASGAVWWKAAVSSRLPPR